MHAIDENDLLESMRKNIEIISRDAVTSGSLALTTEKHLQAMSDVDRAKIEFVVNLIRNTTILSGGTVFMKSRM